MLWQTWTHLYLPWSHWNISQTSQGHRKIIVGSFQRLGVVIAIAYFIFDEERLSVFASLIFLKFFKKLVG